MFVKLTNALPGLKDQPLIINPAFIIAVHRNTATREDGSKEEVTYISSASVNWEVVEDIEVVLDLFNRALKGN